MTEPYRGKSYRIKKEDEPPEFDTDFIMELVKKYSFPRQIGSDGEKKVRSMIFREFEELGYKPKEETFVCTLFYSKWLLPSALIYLLILVGVTQPIKFYFEETELIMDIIFIGCFAGALIYFLTKVNKPHRIQLGHPYYSSNVFVFVPAEIYGTDKCPPIFHEYGLVNIDDYPEILKRKEIPSEEIAAVSGAGRKRGSGGSADLFSEKSAGFGTLDKKSGSEKNRSGKKSGNKEGKRGFISKLIRKKPIPIHISFDDKSEWRDRPRDEFAEKLDREIKAEEVPEPEADEIPHGNIIISAHSDSKTQKFTTVQRIKIFRNTLIILSILFIGWVIGFVLNYVFDRHKGFTFTTPFSFGITFVLAFFATVLIINQNVYYPKIPESPGALDNASGMALVFCLAEYFRTRPLKHFNLWFIQFGVEEFGQAGTRNFLLARMRFFKRFRTFNFNADMVGTIEDDAVPIVEYYGMIKQPVDPLMMQFIRESAEELNIPIYTFNVPTGARTDGKVFHKYGYNSIDFASKTAAKWAHSGEDTPDKVNPDIIADACRIIIRSVEKMDKALGEGRFGPPKEAKHFKQAYM